MGNSTTLIRVPVDVRDRVKRLAESCGETYGEVIDRGMELVEQELFWGRVAKVQPDEDYLREFAEWDSELLEGGSADVG
jgi:hypothetical protein